MADQNQMNIDQIVQMCQNAVSDIIQAVGGVGNLLQDDGRMALIQSIAQRLTQLGADVDTILGPQLAQAYHQGMTDADALLSQAGKDVTMSGVNKQVHLAGVQSIVADTMADMSASFRTALIMAVSDIDGILAEVNQDIATGMIKGDPSGYTAQKVAQTFAKSGMTSFVTKDGKRLPLDFYAQTVTRTKYRVAHTTGAVNRYQESGVYHVKIDEHSPTCKHCARFQGMVIALHKDHAQGFPVAGEGDAKLPPYHPNCQHTARPFVMEGHSQTDINKEKRKWNSFDPDHDVRSDNEKQFYKTEQDIRKKARQEMKEYNIMKQTMPPEDVPKSLASYRRMKRKNDDSWKALQQKYKDHMGISNANGPTDPGTPKKKKGSKVGTSGPSQASQNGTQKAKKKKATTKKATTPKATTGAKKKATKKSTTSTATQTNQTSPANVQSVQTSTGLKLTDADQKAVTRFDQIIDGIEFNDRRKTSDFILKQIPGWKGKIKIAKISANGHCSDITVPGGKVNIGEFALQSQEHRPIQYQWKTMFHEYFHANLNGLDYKPTMFKGSWTKWEESATECSAFFMSDRAGINIHTITPSYSDYLVETLPQLKQLPEFADCVDMRDFGARFMKYRYDPANANGDWTWLDQKAKGISINKDKYFNDHYKDHIMENLDEYTDMIVDHFQQDKTYSDRLRQSVRTGLWDGCISGTVNREVRMALPIAMNRIGVK
jgi:hypothetical protein